MKRFWLKGYDTGIVSLIILALIVIAVICVREDIKDNDRANKTCYPYAMIFYNDDIVVCAAPEGAVVKKMR